MGFALTLCRRRRLKALGYEGCEAESLADTALKSCCLLLSGVADHSGGVHPSASDVELCPRQEHTMLHSSWGVTVT